MNRQTGTAVVERVNRAYPQLLRHNTNASCGEFLQRVCAEPECRAERVGLLSKSPGENGYTFPNGQRTSHDVIAWPNGERIDIIQSAGGSPAPGGPTWQVIPPEHWRPSNVWVDVSGWPIFPSGAPDTAVESSCVLAFGWFCWMRAWADWPQDAQRNEDWINGEIGPKVWRVMLAVEGQSHGNPDPWRDAGVFIHDGTWEDRFKRMLDHVGANGQQIHATVYGGRNQTNTHDERCRFHDRIVAAAQGKWGAIKSFEMMNEFRVNRWEPEEVRSSGRDLRSKVPANTLIALSSPHLAHAYVNDRQPTNEEMAESFDELYGGDAGDANFITIHTMRDGGKWSDPFAYNAFYPHMQKVHNEPPGPGTSAGGEHTTGAEVHQDFSRAMQAGWKMYVGHSEWSPWNGHLPEQYYNGYREVKWVWELPQMPQCAAAMQSLATGGGDWTPGPTPPSPGPQPPTSTGQLLSGMSLLPGQTLVSPAGHARLHYQSDANLVVYLDGQPVWASHTDGQTAGSLQMQLDGNLVLQNAQQQPVGATRTDGHPGAMVQLQDDGAFVVYESPSGPLAGTPLWTSAEHPEGFYS